MVLPDLLRWCPGYVPGELRRLYLQDPDAHHRQRNRDAHSLRLGTQCDPIVLDEAEEDTAAAQVPTDHLQQAYVHRTCVPLPPAVEIHAGLDVGAVSTRTQLRHVAVSPSPQLDSRQLSNMVGAFEQQHRPALPVFLERRLLRDVESQLLRDDEADLDCSTPTLLLKKKLTSTDTNLSQCRLSVPKSVVQQNFTAPLFWQQEIDMFGTRDGFPVTAFDQNGEKYTMRLKLWQSCRTYVLLGSWKEFLLNNNLHGTEKEIGLWAYRHPHTMSIVFLIIPAH